MRVEDFLDYVKEAKAKGTFKNYANGINKFVEWYGKDANTILKELFEDLKEIIRAWGLNPEKILTREALAQEATTYLGFDNKENNQLKILRKALRDLIRQETAGQMRTVDGGPVGN